MDQSVWKQNCASLLGMDHKRCVQYRLEGEIFTLLCHWFHLTAFLVGQQTVSWRGGYIILKESGHAKTVSPLVIKNSCTSWVAGSDTVSKGFHTSDKANCPETLDHITKAFMDFLAWQGSYVIKSYLSQLSQILTIVHLCPNLKISTRKIKNKIRWWQIIDVGVIKKVRLIKQSYV